MNQLPGVKLDTQDVTFQPRLQIRILIPNVGLNPLFCDI